MGARWPYKSLSPYVLISHESFTYVSPDVFSVYYKSLIINILQDTVRVSFPAPNASQKCGAFLFGGQVTWVCRAQFRKRLIITPLQNTHQQTVPNPFTGGNSLMVCYLQVLKENRYIRVRIKRI